MASQAADALWTPLRLTYRAADLVASQRLGADAAARHGHLSEPVCRARQGFGESDRGRHAVAVAVCTAAVTRATALNHPQALATALAARSRAARKAGDLLSAQTDANRHAERAHP